MLTDVPTLEKKLLFTYRHIGQSICSLRISMGRGYVALSTHHSSTSQTVDNIWAVSGYVHCSSTTYHRTYCLLSILVDIQHILSQNNPVEISDTIDRRLDDFQFQFQV